MNATDLILFAGQSNMQGQTEALPADNSPVEGAWEYRYATDALLPLCHPVGEDLDTEGRPFVPDRSDLQAMLKKAALLSSWMGNANMVPSFCRSYRSVTGRNAVAVHVAKGSTTVSYWQKGGAGYEVFVKKAKAAIEKVKPERVLLAWLQGESDALASTSKEDYARLLTQLKNDWKAEVSLECFGILLVGRFAGDERDDAIIDAQRELCQADGDFLLLTDAAHKLWNDPIYMNPHVKGHFSCAGQERLGELAGTALGNYVNQKK